MIPVYGYSGQNVAVLGLGRTGRSVVKALKEGGAEVFAWDDSETTRKEIENDNFELRNLNNVDWSEIKALVLSPGIPYKFPSPHRIVKCAEQNGIPIIGDTELFAQWVNRIPKEKRPIIVGVTGTNGKSTTTAMIAHTLRYAGFFAQMGGNIGTGVLDLSPDFDNAVFVLELSSYQLDLTRSLHCNISILLNISADHIDRHGNLDNYVEAKQQIFRNQTTDDIAVISTEDSFCRSITSSITHLVKVVDLPNDLISKADLEAISSLDRQTQEYVDTYTMVSDTHFNRQNVNATYVVGKRLGIRSDTITKALDNFEGLEHRKEFVARLGAVSFINDSKATNEASVRDALSSYKNIYWIAGGRAKENSFDVLNNFVDNVKRGYFIGEARLVLEQTFKNVFKSESCTGLEEAVKKAFEDAAVTGNEATVVLSPACASFDQFKNFEHRGEEFKKIVKNLMPKNRGQDR